MATIVATPEPEAARVKLDITFTNTAVTAVKVERRDPGAPWLIIRSGTSVAATAGAVTVWDAEAPFDTVVTYRVSQVTPTGSETGEVSTLVGSVGVTWLKDPAFPSRSLPLNEVTALPEVTFASRSGVFAVIDRPRPIVVAARRESWTGTLRFTTTTSAERTRVHDLLARGQVLLLATPAAYGIGNQYVHVGDAVEERVGLVTEQSRRWSLPLTNVDRPESLAVAPRGLRWVDVKFKYPTWGDLLATGMTWDQLLESEP